MLRRALRSSSVASRLHSNSKHAGGSGGRIRSANKVTVSASTRSDLLRFGFRAEGVYVVHNGAEPAPQGSDVERGEEVIYLGRMERTKNPSDAVRCYDILRDRLETATVVIVSHQPETLEKFCRTAAVLHHGKLEMFDTLEEAKRLYDYQA